MTAVNPAHRSMLDCAPFFPRGHGTLMWFRNLVVYRLPADWTLSAAELEEQLGQRPLPDCVMAGELGKLLSDLVHAFGGEQIAQAAA